MTSTTGGTSLRIGTAGWSIPRAAAGRVDGAGTHLERYARRFRGVEINSSFYRPHRAATYARWRDSTPPDFRFAVKLPRTMTHDLKLEAPGELLVDFLAQTGALGEKRGPILMQTPPSLSFHDAVVTRFLTIVRERYDGPLVCEPRHGTWFTAPVSALLTRFGVARVAADPAQVPEAAVPGGAPHLAYYRLHGSPRMYWSRYDEPFLAAVAAGLRARADGTDVWCVFDNTASGAAIDNAWDLQGRVVSSTPAPVADR